MDPIPIISYLELKYDIYYIIYYHLSGSLKNHKEYYRKEYRDSWIISQIERSSQDNPFLSLFLILLSDILEKFWEE
jgi:hypothetical protein